MSYNPPFGDETPFVFGTAYVPPGGNELAFNFYNGPLPDPVLARSDMEVPLGFSVTGAATVSGHNHPLLALSFTVSGAATAAISGAATAALSFSAASAGGTSVYGAASPTLRLSAATYGGTQVTAQGGAVLGFAGLGYGVCSVRGAGAPVIQPTFTTAGLTRLAGSATLTLPLSISVQAGTTVFGETPVFFFQGTPLVGCILKPAIDADGLVSNLGTGAVGVSFGASASGIAAVMGGASYAVEISPTTLAAVEVRGTTATSVPLLVTGAGSGHTTGVFSATFYLGRNINPNLIGMNFAASGDVPVAGAAAFDMLPARVGYSLISGCRFETAGIVGRRLVMEMPLQVGDIFSAQGGGAVGRTLTAVATLSCDVTAAGTVLLPTITGSADALVGLEVAADNAAMRKGSGAVEVGFGMAALGYRGAQAQASARLPLTAAASAGHGRTGAAVSSWRATVAAAGCRGVSGVGAAQMSYAAVGAGQTTQRFVGVGAVTIVPSVSQLSGRTVRGVPVQSKPENLWVLQ